MSARNRGRCACGAIAYVVLGELRDVTNCHCARCRRVTGLRTTTVWWVAEASEYHERPAGVHQLAPEG